MSKIIGYRLKVYGLKRGHWETLAISRFYKDREILEKDITVFKQVVEESFGSNRPGYITIENTVINILSFASIRFFIDRDHIDEKYFDGKE